MRRVLLAVDAVLDDSTERPMLDGSFNDVAPVDHVGLALAMGFQAARRVARQRHPGGPRGRSSR